MGGSCVKYVYMCVYVCTCMYVCIHTRTSMCVFVCVCVCKFLGLFLHSTHTHTQHIHTCIYLSMPAEASEEFVLKQNSVGQVPVVQPPFVPPGLGFK